MGRKGPLMQVDAPFHEQTLAVRDYECDIQGIVNNARYLHYLEHARNSFCREIGIDFAAFHQKGLDVVVARMELEFKSPLFPGDVFSVKTTVKQEGRFKYVFFQEISRKDSGQISLKARVVVTCLKEGRLYAAPELKQKVEQWGSRQNQQEGGNGK